MDHDARLVPIDSLKLYGRNPRQGDVAAIRLRNSSVAGDVVLDPFGGSGSTLMACEHLGRRARLLELDPRYVDVIVRRWENHTGRKAERVDGP